MSSAITFTFFLITFIAVGLLSTYKQSNGSKHYLLANRAISPLFVALSAAASKYSGYMFIGLMGYIYTHGLSAIWIVLGFLVGDFIALYVAHHSLRAATTTTRALSFSGLISRWHYGDYQKLRLSIGMITLIFLSTFAAAQFNAGGKALHAVFGWNYQIGAILCAILILSYSVIGGLKASIWTDVMQAIIMLFALGILLIYSLQKWYRDIGATAHHGPPYGTPPNCQNLSNSLLLLYLESLLSR